MKADKSSILDMAMGAIKERVDYEMGHIVDDILDTNTEAKKKRKLTLTLEFSPDADRQTIVVNCTANDGRVGLFEADGGMWEMDAKKEIDEYFEKALNGLISDGHVVVMM